MDVKRPNKKIKTIVNPEDEHDLEQIIFSSAQDVVEKLTAAESTTDIRGEDDQTNEVKPTAVEKAAWVDEDDGILVSKGPLARAKKPDFLAHPCFQDDSHSNHEGS